jgi:hypothetical protein
MTSISSISSANPILPNDVIGNIIFSNLSLPALGTCSRVCKVWNKMAGEQMKAFSHESAFGPKEWYEYFGGYLRNIPRLPPNMTEIMNSPCPFSDNKKVYETHLLVLIPETVSGQPLTLKTLGELVKKPFTGTATQYSGYNFGEYTDPNAPPSHWVLMTRGVIEGSRNKSYQTQQALLNQKAGGSYAVPTILDATVCIFMEYFRTGTRLYPDSPSTFTRCQEKYDANWQLGVGGFAPGGLLVSHYGYDFEFNGVGGSRKF